MKLTVGTYLPSYGKTCFKSLDGSDVAKWLEKNGEKVIEYYDTGRNGLAITEKGITISTNGYISKT